MEITSKRKRPGVLLRTAIAAVAAGFMMSDAAFAQSNLEGYVYGTVSGAVGQTVSVRNKDTGLAREGKISGDGVFRISSLPVGTYEVSVTIDGKELKQTVSVSIGEGALVSFAGTEKGATRMEDVVVVASAGAAVIDTLSVESATNVTAEQIERVPIPRNLSSIQELAPDSAKGSSDFTTQQGQPLISFGGASPLENAFFINGFNVTDFRKGLGSSEIPFEFLKEVQLKTGGYSAEFGRSLGGVINAVSKTGTNAFNAGGNVFFEPDWGRADQPNYFYPDGTPYAINSEDTRRSLEANAYAGGPIIRDRLFAYGMIGVRDFKSENLGGDAAFKSTQESDGPAYYALNLLANIVDGHSVQVTTFSDERDLEDARVTYDYDAGAVVSTPNDGLTKFTTGGQTYIVNYNGQMTDWFVLSALYGKGEIQEITDAARADGGPCPLIADQRGSGSALIGCVPANSFATDILDTREAYRLDAAFSFDALGFHQLRVGVDREDLETDFNQVNIGGGVRYIYDTCENPDGCTLNGVTIDQGTEYLRERTQTSAGVFNNILTAFYIQDNWQINQKLLLALGLRNDTFDLRDLSDKTFIKQSEQIGPRIGFSYDILGDARYKVFANYGRYFMPIETNTAARNLTVRQDTNQYFTYDSVGADGLPVNPVAFTEPAGEISEGAQPAFDKDLEPTTQDEYIAGFQMDLAPRWALGVKGTYRELVSAIEDTCIIDADFNYGCVILNPGDDAVIDGQDYNFDGEPDFVTLTAEEIGLPAAERKYYAVEFKIDRIYDGKWFMSASYTWSHLYGNFEGYAKSDTGQADPGISSTFDTPGLVAYGDLPNDHRHNFKIWGSYSLTDELQVGANFRAISGRPFNRFGSLPAGTPGYPNDDVISVWNEFYAGEFSYVDGQRVGRGDNGRLPWIVSLDLAARYQPKFVPGLTMGFDVFNVFNKSVITNVDEAAEIPSGDNPTYGFPRAAGDYSPPRSLRFSLGYDFWM